MTPDLRFDGALLTLRLSQVRRLERLRTSEWLPSPARLVLGGVGMDAAGDLCGWLAYGRDERELDARSWPENVTRRPLEDNFPATVEIVVVYHGGEWRRAVGAVNARLIEQCAARGGGVAADLVERAWLVINQQQRADAFREAQRLRRQRSAA